MVCLLLDISSILILKDIEDMDFPIYQASKETEIAYEKAITEHKAGGTDKVKDIDVSSTLFFRQLVFTLSKRGWTHF